MNVTRHVYDRYINAPPETVWAAITRPDLTRRYFHGTAFTAVRLAAGEPYVYAMDDGRPAIVGEIVSVEPSKTLTLTFSFRYDPTLATEPSSQVEWSLTPAGAGITRVTLRHGELARSPGTWERVRLGWVAILDNLKTFIETGEALGDIETPIDSPPDEVDGAWHRAQAVAANNATWDLLATVAVERAAGTTDIAGDVEELVRHAYAAAFHWDRARGRGPANAARADWLLSRVWAVIGNGSLSLRHAQRCAETCAMHDIDDFDLAYAFEARARALACLGRREEARSALAEARAVVIADPEDAAIVNDDLAAEPWYGLHD